MLDSDWDNHMYPKKGYLFADVPSLCTHLKLTGNMSEAADQHGSNMVNNKQP